MILNKLIGDRKFYRRLFALALPIMVQNFITNFVNMLDNIMVGNVGTVQMNGVAVSNQLLFVFNLCIFGAVSGVGIFTAQFYGKGDTKGVRDTFRFKLIVCGLISLVGIFFFWFFGDRLIHLYLRGEGSPADAAASLLHGEQYLKIMMLGIIPYALVQCYSGTLRETGESVVPMTSGIVAVLVNLGLNSILIFGLLGFPAFGSNGAAIATVISRFVELAVVAVWTRVSAKKHPFILGAYRSLRIPKSLIRPVVQKGLPLMLNEALWAAGMATVNQGYSALGLDVVGANNIASTFWNVFAIAFMAVGAAVGIILGQMLGAGKTKEAKGAARKLIATSVMISIVMAILYILSAKFIPNAYRTTDEIRLLATRLMQIGAIAMPLDAFAHATYFTLRSGGKTVVTFIFDSCFVWAVNVPTVMLLSRFTDLSVLWIFGIVQFSAILKCILGTILVEKGSWIRNIVGG